MKTPVRIPHRLMTVVRGLTYLVWVALIYQPQLPTRPFPEPSMPAEQWRIAEAAGGIASGPNSVPDVVTGTLEIPEIIYRTPVDPNAVYLPGPTSPPTQRALTPSKPETTTVAPGDFALYRDSVISGANIPPPSSTYYVVEPTAAMNGRMVLYSGNKFDELSADYGQTFSFLNPYTNPPPNTNGFCCDQVTYYDRTRGLTLWFRQYHMQGDHQDSPSSADRLSVARGQYNLANALWTDNTMRPQDFGYPAYGVWFDYPDIAVTNNYVYITTNVFSQTSTITNAGINLGALIFRASLDALASGGVVTWDKAMYPYPSGWNLKLAHGSTDTMYFASTLDNNTIRIYSWPDNSSLPSFVDRDVDAWYDVPFIAIAPDNSNFLGYENGRIRAAWVAKGQVGLMWDSAQGTGFPYPHVRWARFNLPGLNLADQGQIWNPGYAWAYPSAHPNDRGDVGGTIAFGGGALYPGSALWISDSYNGNTLQPLEYYAAAFGNSGGPPVTSTVGINHWGDYLDAQRAVPYSNTWVGTGYVLDGGYDQNNVRTHFFWFGREQDRPPANNTIYVDKASTTWEDGSAAHPYRKIFDGHFATVAGDTIVIQAGLYNTIPGPLTLDRASTITSQNGVVTIGQ
jgi:hypothetical protein